MNLQEMKKIINDRSKRNYIGDADEEREYKEAMARLLWTTLL